LGNNLNLSGVLALVNELLKGDFPKEDVLATVLDFDKVLALNLEKAVFEKETKELSFEIKDLLEKRMLAKKEKHYEEADKIRNQIEEMGYKLLDTPEGQKLEQA
jgi:cysteinyl-tRNA synthetase